MADRKVYIILQVKLVMRVDEGTEIEDVVNELDYTFNDTTGNATVEDSTVADYAITDSK